MMSNDKVAATFGPAPTHVRVRETLKAGTVEMAYDDGRFLVRFEEDEVTTAPTYAVYDREDLISGWTETTGEHTKAKLADDLYQDFIDPKDVPEHHHALPELTDAQVDRLYEAISHRGPERGWFPTPVEIIMSLCIMAAIVGGFIWSVMIGLW